VTYLGEYISGMEADTTFSFLTGYVQDLDDEMYHDLIVDYRMGEDRNGLISVGITNFTDEEPPYIDAGFNANTDPSTFRLFGRSYFVRLKYSL
jgi:iron complex outermembrane receptor protein